MKKRASFLLQIPKPCQQAWEEMQPVAGGRFCAHCQKCVTDITAMSDRQLAGLMQDNPQGLCVRALSSQLNRPIHWPVQEPTHFYRLAIALGLSLVLLGAGEAHARPHPPLTEQYSFWTTEDSTQKQETHDTVRISGAIVDEKGEPFAGVVVKLTQDGVMRSGAISEDDGIYQIYGLIVDANRGSFELEFSAISYKTKRVKIGRSLRSANLDIALDELDSSFEFIGLISKPINNRNKPGNRSYDEDDLKHLGF